MLKEIGPRVAGGGIGLAGKLGVAWVGACRGAVKTPGAGCLLGTSIFWGGLEAVLAAGSGAVDLAFSISAHERWAGGVAGTWSDFGAGFRVGVATDDASGT